MESRRTHGKGVLPVLEKENSEWLSHGSWAVRFDIPKGHQLEVFSRQ